MSTVESHGGYEYVHAFRAPGRHPNGTLLTVERGARWYVQCALCKYKGKPGATVASAATRPEAESLGAAHLVDKHKRELR